RFSFFSDSAEDAVDHRLPVRLFATDRFPRRRLNVYSRPNILAFLRHILRGSPVFTRIRESPFGKLFDLPARQCPVSCKLIHGLLSRQLLCNQEHTLWTVFGKDPLRFSLEEFGTITGLNCGAFPEGYEAPDHNQTGLNKQKGAHKDPMWKELIGKYNNITIADLADELENDEEMDDERRFRLALIIIVDGVLIASQQVHRPTLRYVQMLGDVDAFLEFPWGRESFLHTVRCMKPPKFEKGKLVEDRVGMLVQKLKQSSFRLTGFPLALQLLAFRAIPMLQSKIPAPSNELTIMELTEPNLPSHPSIELDSVLQVEVNPSLLVTPIIPIARGPQPGWGVWPNVEVDEKVGYMEQLIANNHQFTKSMWPGGDCSEPVFIVTPPPVQPEHKKHTVPRKRKDSKLKPRKCSKKRASTTSQRRITRLFAASSSTPVPTNDLLEARTRVNHLLNRKRKRSTTGSLLSQRLVKHRRRSTPQTPRTITKPPTPKHPHNVTLHTTLPTTLCLFKTLLPPTLMTTTLLTTALPTTNLLTTKISNINHPSTTLQPITQLSTTPLLTTAIMNNILLTTQLATTILLTTKHLTTTHLTTKHLTTTHQTINHNHLLHTHSTNLSNPLQPKTHLSTTKSPHAPKDHTPDPKTPDHITTPHLTTNQQPLEHKPSDLVSPTHPSPVHVSTPSSPPTHKVPVDAFNVTQGSPSQNFAQIATLPQFDATPLGKPTS
ncbi:unnamed protein product, partial [Brassica rapa subsp. narinosa]